MSATVTHLETPPPRSTLRLLLGERGAQVGLALVALLVTLTLAAPLLAPGNPNQVSPPNAFRPPGVDFLMGTDNLGRDVFARFLHGGRSSLQVGVVAALIGSVGGIFFGVLAGYYGGLVDSLISWLVEVLMAFPGVLLALTVVAILGPGITNVILAVGISFIPSFTRVTRAAVLQVRELDFVEAAKALGASGGAIMWRHILPNILRPVTALVALGVGTAILEGAALSFLGLGTQPPNPEWGAMLNAGRAFVGQAWWVTLFPGAGIFLSVLAVNLISDALSDVADPTYQIGRRKGKG